MGVAARTNLIIGAAAVVVALLLALVWIPLDTDTGLIEKVRRRVVIGDALAPSVAAAFLLLGGALLALREGRAPDQAAPGWRSLLFIGQVVAALALSIALMRFAGLAAVEIANALDGEAREYRLLRDTTPWKHIGFFLGGAVLIASLIALVEGRFSRRGAVLGALATLAMIAIYDLPFEDLLLPPNGDV